MLSVYNATYLLSTTIVKGHLITCFIIAVLLSLIALFVIAWVDLLKETKEEENKLEREQGLVRKKLRDEYLKVHKMKIKNELLMKAGCLPPDPSLSLENDFGEVKEVHFNYVKGMDPHKKARGQPEGT